MDADPKTTIPSEAPSAFHAATCSALPDHHARYARAWILWRDEGLPEAAKVTLENEMDAAQNFFGWDEFQTFKASLPGFSESWKRWAESFPLNS